MLTKTDISRAKLTPAQLVAIDHLATGSTITDAAKAADVARQTVAEWMNRNPAFQAALNARRAELWSETADRLRALLPRALATIEAAIEAGGPDALPAALALVKLARIDPTAAGSTDAAEIEAAQAERDKETRRRKFYAGA